MLLFVVSMLLNFSVSERALNLNHGTRYGVLCPARAQRADLKQASKVIRNAQDARTKFQRANGFAFGVEPQRPTVLTQISVRSVLSASRD